MDPNRWDRKRARFERKRQRWERQWERKAACRSNPSRHLFGGIVLMTIGMVFLLGNMGLVDAGYIFRYWPVILIAGGVLKLLEQREDYQHNTGIFWIVVGGLFLTGSLGILRFALWNFWPIVLIGFGALLLWRSAFFNPGARERQNRPPDPPFMAGEGWTMGPAPGAAAATPWSQPPEMPNSGLGDSAATGAGSQTGYGSDPRSGAAASNSFVSAMAILGSVQRRNNSPDFRGGSATAVMGGCEIDLRAASIAPGAEAVLEVFAMWGGIEIIVPPDWTVVSRVDPILGGYEDSTLPPKEERKRFVIRGTVLMGGIEVTN